MKNANNIIPKIDLKQVGQLLKLNNPFYFVTDEKFRLKLISEASNKIFNSKLKLNSYISKYLKDFNILKFDKKETVLLESVDGNQKFKFNCLKIDSDTIAFVFIPVINYLNPIKNYHITISDFESINYLSEYIFLSETTRGSLNDYDKIVTRLNQQNRNLRKQNNIIESLSRFPKENPNPVLRIDETNKVLYINTDTQKYIDLFKIDTNNYINSKILIQILNECIQTKHGSITRVISNNHITYNLTIRYDANNKDFNLYLTDITEYNNQIIKLKTFYEEILDEIPIDIAVFDKYQKFIYINKKAVKNDDLRHFLIGKTDLDYAIHRNKSVEIAEFRMRKIRETFEKKNISSWIDEYGDEDNKRYILRTLYPIITKPNEPITRVVGSGVDITKTLQYKQSLIDNEKKWRTLLKHSSDLICVLNTNCEIIFISNSVKEILDFEAKELLHKSIKQFVHPDDILNPETCCMTSEDAKINYEIMRFKQKSGSYTLLRVAMRFDEEIYNHPCIILNAHDISELKRAEAQRFMTGIASEENERRRIARDLHDGVGQYLATAMLYSSLLGKYVEQEMTHEGKQIYQNTVKMLKKVTDEVRLVSHNLMPSTVKDFGFLNAVRQLVNDLKESNPAIKFIYNEKIIDPDIGFSEQIGLNLFRSIQQIFNNALKHGKPQQIILTIYYHNGSLKITVIDDGAGFDTKKDHYKKGIGLKSIFDRITNLGGEMNVSSAIKKGTQVILKIDNLKLISNKNYDENFNSR